MALSKKQCHFLSLAIAITIALLLVAVIMLIWLKTTQNKSQICTDQHLPGVGNSSGWKSASKMLINAMDTYADPCEDFYQFACGKWIQTHPVKPPADREGQKTSTLRVMVEQLSAALSLVQPDNTSQPVFLRITKLVFNSCMDNFHQKEYDWINLIRSTLQHDFNISTWPMRMGQIDKNNSVFDIYDAIGQLKTYGISGLLKIEVKPDWTSPLHHAVYIKPGKLGLKSKSYYLNKQLKPQLNSYKAKIKKYMKMFSANPAIVHEAAERVIQLESDISKEMQSKDPVGNLKLENNRFNLSGLWSRWPKLNWTNVLKDVPVDNLTIFIVTNVVYIDKIFTITQSVSPEVLANYIAWLYLSKLLPYRPKPMGLKKRSNSSRTLFLELGPQDEVITCFILLGEHMSFAIGHLYYHIHSTAMKEAMYLYGYVKEELLLQLEQASLLDEVSRAGAKKKVENTVANIGFPPWINNKTYLEHMYANLAKKLQHVNTTNFHDVINVLLRDNTHKEYSELSSFVDRYHFHFSPTAFFAGADPVRNSFTSPATWMNTPYFNGSFPMPIQFATYGWLLSRLLSQGVNVDGIKFLADGSLGSLFSKKSMNIFNEKAKCFQNQYEKYCYPAPISLCIDGNATLAENLADNLGLVIAYGAYNQWRKDWNAIFPQLPDLRKYSWDQVFFLSYANIWCRNELQSATEAWLLTDRYSPAMYRILGTVKNFQSFGEAFNCKNNSTLNPAHNEQCKLY